MAQIPLNTQFIGLASTVDTTERRSAAINAESAPYTMQDIVDTAGTGVPGPQGVAGPVGPAGVAGPVGPAGLNWEGAWVSGTSYVEDDAVGYDGASYFCILATSGTTTPNLATANWALLASQGAIGAQGATGLQGPTGATGPGVPAYLESNITDVTIWNNGQGDISSNTSFGEEALKSNTTGGGNTSIGVASLRDNTSGTNNTAIGNGNLLNNTIGSANTAMGVGSLELNTVGNNNTAIGAQSLPNATGSFNTAVGAGSLLNTSIGTNNIGIGAGVAQAISSGSNNVIIGGASAAALQTGFGNVVIGKDSNVASFGTNFAIAIGQEAVAESYAIAIGVQATSGGYNYSVVLGSGATGTANNQFVVGSTSQAVGAVTTETVSSTRTWSVVINGVARKILLA